MKSPTNPSGLPFPWRPTTLGGRAPENARRAAERSTPPSQASHDGIPKQASMTGCDRRGLIIGTANSLSRCSMWFIARKIMEIWPRSEEHTSELQSLMRISYAVFCLKKTKKISYRLQDYRKRTYKDL